MRMRMPAPHMRMPPQTTQKGLFHARLTARVMSVPWSGAALALKPPTA